MSAVRDGADAFGQVEKPTTRASARQVGANDAAPTYSIIVPVYGNEAGISRLTTTLSALAEQLDAPCEVVFVVDGSPDRSLETLLAHGPSMSCSVKIVEHSRNFGSFPAIRTGLSCASGQFMGVIAADLQEPPELLTSFFSLLSSGQADVVVGRRTSRNDPTASAAGSRLYWALYRKLVNPDLPPGGVDVFGLNRKTAEHLLDLNESASSLIGQLYWMGFRRLEVPYTRQARLEGKSGWTLRKKFRYLADSIYAFTDLPIRLLTMVGTLGLVGSFVAAVIVFTAWINGRIEVSGYTPLMLVLLACTFLLVLGLGVVGSYVARTYENTKNRPISVVSGQTEFPGGGRAGA